jgi:hypothetical protein
VARVVGDSRAYVLLSRREGANKAMYEALFCDTPVVVHRRHRGINADHVTGRVGVTFDEGTLADALLAVLDRGGFEPRAWALEHTGYDRSTQALDEVLRGLSAARGLPWTRGLEPKQNAPNLRYARPGAWRDFEGEYEALRAYLVPAG